MKFLPICVNLENCHIVVIGGGKVAAQKLRTLCTTPARIVLFATNVSPDVKGMNVEWHQQPYQPEQLSGARLVYACTDDKELNRTIAQDARAQGILVNVADDPANCNFISPALWTHENMTVAVTSDGK